jgi:hypothetical protein
VLYEVSTPVNFPSSNSTRTLRPTRQPSLPAAGAFARVIGAGAGVADTSNSFSATELCVVVVVAALVATPSAAPAVLPVPVVPVVPSLCGCFSGCALASPVATTATSIAPPHAIAELESVASSNIVSVSGSTDVPDTADVSDTAADDNTDAFLGGSDFLGEDRVRAELWLALGSAADTAADRATFAPLPPPAGPLVLLLLLPVPSSLLALLSVNDVTRRRFFSPLAPPAPPVPPPPPPLPSSGSSVRPCFFGGANPKMLASYRGAREFLKQQDKAKAMGTNHI